jgi:hypothetical protein
VSCYMRQMRWLFEALDLEYDKANRRRVDAAVREVLAMPPGAHCPEVWSAVKGLSPDEQAGLPIRVAEVLASD